jgi:hypothetical protein
MATSTAGTASAAVAGVVLHGLDPAGHFTQQKQITVVPKGEKFTLADITTSKFEAYDSLARVYGLYATLCKDLC